MLLVEPRYTSTFAHNLHLTSFTDVRSKKPHMADRWALRKGYVGPADDEPAADAYCDVAIELVLVLVAGHRGLGLPVDLLNMNDET